ncbi:hypothetical protein QY96_03091 [Bacillus thermotolerans]|nr:hypothetical protein QY96_03091 [Bacillus thermotolerans]
MNIYLRFPERESEAATFLTRDKYLPPLNFGRERIRASNGPPAAAVI